MATLYWRGGTSGDFSLKANWVDATGATPSLAPANNDTLIFDWGSVDVDAGLTTGLTGITLIGTTGYAGRMAPGAYLNIACSTLRWAESGELNIGGNITNGKVSCRSGSSFSYQTGTATALFIDRTDFFIAAAAVVTTLRAQNSTGSDQNNATQYSKCQLIRTNMVTRRKGVFELGDQSTLTAKTGGELDDGTVIRGLSKLYYMSSKTIAGGDTIDVEPGSVFDARANQLFTWDGELGRWPGALVYLDTAGGKVTPATDTSYGLSSNIGGAIPKA